MMSLCHFVIVSRRFLEIQTVLLSVYYFIEKKRKIRIDRKDSSYALQFLTYYPTV